MYEKAASLIDFRYPENTNASFELESHFLVSKLLSAIDILPIDIRTI